MKLWICIKIINLRSKASQLKLITKKKKINLSSSVGGRLREARKKRGFDIDEIASKINIQGKYLDSLEKGEYNNLPADVYIDSFFKKYAEFLDIFDDDFFNFYRKEKQVFRNIRDKSNQQKDESGKFLQLSFTSHIYITPKIISFSVLIIVILFIVFYFWHQVDFLVSAPELIVENPSYDIETSNSSIVIMGKTDYDAFVKINNQSIILNADGSFSEEIDLAPGLNVLEIKSVNRLSKESSVVRNVFYSFKDDGL
jgi:transcriptional regulator with XRE-family HTH domain